MGCVFVYLGCCKLVGSCTRLWWRHERLTAGSKWDGWPLEVEAGYRVCV